MKIRRWERNDDATLIELWSQPLTVEDIADAMGRGATTIGRRVRMLKLPPRASKRRPEQAQPQAE